MVTVCSFGVHAIILILGIVVFKNVKKFKETNISSKNISTVVAAIGILTITASLPVLLALLIIGAICRVAVYFILKIKHGRQYIGLVSGADAVHTIDSPTNSKTCVLGIFEHDYSKSARSVVDAVRDHFDCTLRHMEKFQATYHNFMGYTYMVRTTVDAGECIREIEPQEEIDDEDLVKLLSDTYNSDFPRGNTIFWDIWISARPIRLREISGTQKNYHLSMFRIHHCVADGVAVFKLVVGVLSRPVEGISKLGYPKKPPENNFMSVAKKCVESLKVALFAPSSILVNLLVRGTDQNFLHDGRLNGESHLIFRVEQDDVYFQKVKAIKRRLPGASFPDIILTALSASLSDFYYEKSSNPPKHITVAIPVVPGAAQLQHLKPGSLTASKIKFSNNYALVLLNMPLCVKTSIVSRLNLIKEEVKAINNSVDYQVNYVFMRALSMLPRALIRLVLGTLNCTAAVSIMPGSCKVTCGRDAPIYTDIGFWIPHLKNMGVGFSVFTYDDRLFMGLSVDKSLPISVDEGKVIINNAFSYIDLLEKEIGIQ
ncbi:hypothetical protein PPYR_10760 [Photinus pyralis]|uniref:O-acyltransferase WSD1 C-terminal domain-containing protein n=3 Tax=Photinus pyralis TaxID=7054 RepID=A0A5N4AHC8_PHOPY|nr:uncharacterized protein LOC116174205 [Photinus pyralis]XP_031347946.1 uncharacterized protein LOC116174205 [Photinus pyralis]KAB0796699.1 hypothetical protein PPYR_10760 [Photinus pyralis]